MEDGDRRGFERHADRCMTPTLPPGPRGDDRKKLSAPHRRRLVQPVDDEVEHNEGSRVQATSGTPDYKCTSSTPTTSSTPIAFADDDKERVSRREQRATSPRQLAPMEDTELRSRPTKQGYDDRDTASAAIHTLESLPPPETVEAPNRRKRSDSGGKSKSRWRNHRSSKAPKLIAHALHLNHGGNGLLGPISEEARAEAFRQIRDGRDDLLSAPEGCGRFVAKFTNGKMEISEERSRDSSAPSVPIIRFPIIMSRMEILFAGGGNVLLGLTLPDVYDQIADEEDPCGPEAAQGGDAEQLEQRRRSTGANTEPGGANAMSRAKSAVSKAMTRGSSKESRGPSKAECSRGVPEWKAGPAWVFHVQIYTMSALTDKVVQEKVVSLVTQLQQSGVICGPVEETWDVTDKILGRGAHTEVRRAYKRPGVKRPVDADECALKLISEPANMVSVTKELQILVLVQRHPNIIAMHGMFELGMALWGLALQILPCGDLYDEVVRGPLVEARALEVLSGVLCGLSHVHHRGIVHCDMKAENVLVDQTGRAVIVDFGIAHFEYDCKNIPKPRGSPGYVAPEMLLARYDLVSYSLDMFATGVLFFFLLSGRLPFTGCNVALIFKKTIACHLDFRISAKFEHVGQDSRFLLKSMCKRHPEDRPTAFEGLAAARHLMQPRDTRESQEDHFERMPSSPTSPISPSRQPSKGEGRESNIAKTIRTTKDRDRDRDRGEGGKSPRQRAERHSRAKNSHDSGGESVRESNADGDRETFRSDGRESFDRRTSYASSGAGCPSDFGDWRDTNDSLTAPQDPNDGRASDKKKKTPRRPPVRTREPLRKSNTSLTSESANTDGNSFNGLGPARDTYDAEFGNRGLQELTDMDVMEAGRVSEPALQTALQRRSSRCAGKLELRAPAAPKYRGNNPKDSSLGVGSREEDLFDDKEDKAAVGAKSRSPTFAASRKNEKQKVEHASEGLDSERTEEFRASFGSQVTGGTRESGAERSASRKTSRSSASHAEAEPPTTPSSGGPISRSIGHIRGRLFKFSGKSRDEG